ncbi:MAG TPA: sugar transferase, partial [Chthoniobacterales bacterium]
MLARRQELNTQLQQLIDAFLLALSLWAAYALRYYATSWFNLRDHVDPQSNYAWLLIPIMAFGPILLDLQGFYLSPVNKTPWRSFVQIVRAMIGLSIIVSGCVIFLRLPLANRTVPLLFILIGTIALLIKERWIVAHLRRKAMRGEQREPILLAGQPQDIAALERSFTPEQRLLIDVVGRIDIERQPISDLVEAMHSHAVSRVMFAAGHTQLNRVEEAISACEIEGVPAWLVADFIQTSIAKPDFDAFGGRPMLVFRSTPEV